MKTYEDALFDAHKALLNDIELKIGYKDQEYIEGMLDAARLVLAAIKTEVQNKKGENND